MPRKNVVQMMRDRAMQDGTDTEFSHVVIVDPSDALTREPDYVRRDEHVVHVRVEEGRGAGTGEERDSFFETLLERIDQLTDHVAGARQMINTLFARLDKLAAYIETETRWQPDTLDLDSVGKPATESSPASEPERKYSPNPARKYSPLDYYLARVEQTQRDVARHFQVNVDTLRAALWAEASARGLRDELQKRINTSHRQASLMAREKAIEREVQRRLAEDRR